MTGHIKIDQGSERVSNCAISRVLWRLYAVLLPYYSKIHLKLSKISIFVLKWVEIWYFSETEESENEIIQFSFDPARGT